MWIILRQQQSSTVTSADEHQARHDAVLLAIVLSPELLAHTQGELHNLPGFAPPTQQQLESTWAGGGVGGEHGQR